MKVAIFFLVSLLTVCVVWALDCTHLPDGHYNIACRSYVICSGGKSKQVHCDIGEYYNINTKKCDGGDNIPEPCGTRKDCSNKPDGRYPDLKRACHFYYVCVGQRFMLHAPCPAGLVLNTTSGVCDWRGNVLPPCGTRRA